MNFPKFELIEQTQKTLLSVPPTQNKCKNPTPVKTHTGKLSFVSSA